MITRLDHKHLVGNVIIIIVGILLAGVSFYTGHIVPLPYNDKLISFSKYSLGLTILYLCIFVAVGFVRHGLFTHGLKYYIKHKQLSRNIKQQLYDSGIYVKGYYMNEEVALLPTVKILFSADMMTGTIEIERNIRNQISLDNRDISSALANYIVEASYLSEDANWQIYEIFDSSYVRRLYFKTTTEYIKFIKSSSDKTVVIDKLLSIPITHTLVCGSTGSGKSYFIYLLIIYMHINNKRYELYFADPKISGVFVIGNRINNSKTAGTIDSIIELLRSYHCMLEKRKNLMKKKLSKSKKIDASAFDFKLKSHVLIFDEYLAFSKALSNYDKRTRDEVNSILSDIVLMGRQCGFYIIIIMQSSHASDLSAQIRDNLIFKVVLGQAERSTLEVAFGSSAASDIPKYKCGAGQGFYTYQGLTNKPHMLSIPTINKFDINQII